MPVIMPDLTSRIGDITHAVSDVERISKEAEKLLDDLGYDDAFLKELFEYLIHREK